MKIFFVDFKVPFIDFDDIKTKFEEITENPLSAFELDFVPNLARIGNPLNIFSRKDLNRTDDQIGSHTMRRFGRKPFPFNRRKQRFIPYFTLPGYLPKNRVRAGPIKPPRLATTREYVKEEEDPNAGLESFENFGKDFTSSPDRHDTPPYYSSEPTFKTGLSGPPGPRPSTPQVPYQAGLDDILNPTYDPNTFPTPPSTILSSPFPFSPSPKDKAGSDTNYSHEPTNLYVSKRKPSTRWVLVDKEYDKKSLLPFIKRKPQFIYPVNPPNNTNSTEMMFDANNYEYYEDEYAEEYDDREDDNGTQVRQQPIRQNHYHQDYYNQPNYHNQQNQYNQNHYRDQNNYHHPNQYNNYQQQHYPQTTPVRTTVNTYQQGSGPVNNDKLPTDRGVKTRYFTKVTDVTTQGGDEYPDEGEYDYNDISFDAPRTNDDEMSKIEEEIPVHITENDYGMNSASKRIDWAKGPTYNQRSTLRPAYYPQNPAKPSPTQSYRSEPDYDYGEVNITPQVSGPESFSGSRPRHSNQGFQSGRNRGQRRQPPSSDTEQIDWHSRAPIYDEMKEKKARKNKNKENFR